MTGNDQHHQGVQVVTPDHAVAAGGTHAEEIGRGERFGFGANWARFLRLLNDARIKEAEDSLRSMLGVDDLKGKTFLDIGSGSGLFSLAARQLGAKVRSFDFDPQSVACTLELRRRYFQDDPDWTVGEGSVLDPEFLATLGHFDIVYSWGVLHHTGAMWDALANADSCVARPGTFIVALYNHQPFASRYWTWVKRAYNKSALARGFFIALHLIYPTLPSVLLRKIQGRKYPRGMSPWYDLKDWLGGYPFEVCKPEEILVFFRKRGYNLVGMTTVGGKMGCNEFVLERMNS